MAAGFLVLAGLGATMAATEYRAHFSLRGGVAPVVALLGETGMIHTGFSYHGVNDKISDCLAALDALARPLYSETARRQGAEICHKLANEVLRHTPTLGAAHQLRAETLWRLGHSEAAARALHEAARLAPSTSWLSQRRFALWVQLDPDLSDSELVALVARLIAVPTSRVWLAELYVADPAARRWVERGAAALPVEDARRFLAEIRARSGRQGGGALAP